MGGCDGVSGMSSGDNITVCGPAWVDGSEGGWTGMTEGAVPWGSINVVVSS